MYIALYKLYTKLLFRTKYISEFVSSCTFQQYIIWQWQPIILVKQLILLGYTVVTMVEKFSVCGDALKHDSV